MIERPHRPFAWLIFTRAERFAILVLMLLGSALSMSPYWMPAIFGTGTPEFLPLTESEVAEMNDWIARSEALQDSVDREKAARREKWDKNRTARKRQYNRSPTYRNA